MTGKEACEAQIRLGLKVARRGMDAKFNEAPPES
jgi:hypothetical protein